jgi:hypothetical protein
MAQQHSQRTFSKPSAIKPPAFLNFENRPPALGFSFGLSPSPLAASHSQARERWHRC